MLVQRAVNIFCRDTPHALVAAHREENLHVNAEPQGAALRSCATQSERHRVGAVGGLASVVFLEALESHCGHGPLQELDGHCQASMDLFFRLLLVYIG